MPRFIGKVVVYYCIIPICDCCQKEIGHITGIDHLYLLEYLTHIYVLFISLSLYVASAACLLLRCTQFLCSSQMLLCVDCLTL